MEISLYDAKTHFSNIIQSLIDEKEDSIIITKNGKPVIEMKLLAKKNSKRIGVMKSKKHNDISLEEFDSIDIGSFEGDEL